MILEIDNVELYFREKRILNGIYLKSETGKITGVLGSNGCGKSCLLQIIFGSLKPKYKLIRINNNPILKPLYKSKSVAYLPQHHFIPNKLKTKTIFKLFGLSWDCFISDFETFAHFKNVSFGKLSGGERRLIEVYIILKSPRNVILLDEPFSNLSPLFIESIKKLIEQEKENKIILITDHMYQHIVDCADTIYLVKNGSTKSVSDLRELEDYQYLGAGTLD